MLKELYRKLDSGLAAVLPETFVQMLKYGVVGALAYVVDFGLLILLTEVFGMHYLVSTIFAFIAGILVSYFCSIGWVFGNPDTGSRTRDVVVFFIIGAVGLGLTDLIIWILTEHCGLHYALSKVFATVVVFFWNFFARKLFLNKVTKAV